MQIICLTSDSPERYGLRRRHPLIRPPAECPHCGARQTLRSLGYYERYLSGSGSTAWRIRIRRFRCWLCRKTVSLLPAFAQPYKLVSNDLIEKYVKYSGRCIETEPWIDLLRRYWCSFRWGLPRMSDPILVLAGLVLPLEHPKRSWELLLQWGGSLAMTTMRFTREAQITLFGRYRCHAPNSTIVRAKVHTPYLFPP